MKIYWKFIHMKDIPCHVYGMTSGLSRAAKVLGIAIIAFDNHTI